MMAITLDSMAKAINLDCKENAIFWHFIKVSVWLNNANRFDKSLGYVMESLIVK